MMFYADQRVASDPVCPLTFEVPVSFNKIGSFLRSETKSALYLTIFKNCFRILLNLNWISIQIML
jgi:hypothetical protein